MNEGKEIFEYIRDRRQGKIVKSGVVLGLVDTAGEICVGWSKCNAREGDVFNLEKGLEIARKRIMEEIGNCPLNPPLCIHKQIRRFGSRCVRYFKGANKLILPFPTV